MDHVVATLADTLEMVVPVGGICAHELGKTREQGDSLDRQLLALEREPGTHIDVVCLGPCGLRRGSVREGPLGQRCVGCVEGVCVGFVDGDVDLSDAVEVRRQPGGGVSAAGGWSIYMSWAYLYSRY